MKKELIFKILKELDKNNKVLSQEDVDYNRLICAMNNIPSEIGNSKYKLNINGSY